MKNTVMIGGVVLLLLIGGYFWMTMPKAEVTMEAKTEEKKPFVADKTFEVKGLNYAYDVKEIKVKVGDNVKINFTNTEGMHDFRIDEFGVKTNVIKAGETESAEFVADKKGTFQYYCSVGQHRANGMWGNLIVE